MNHFFALALPSDAQQFVGEVMEGWHRLLPPDVSARWYAPVDCHITLKFLGDVPETRHEEIVQAVAPIGAAVKPFSIALAPCGGFPSLQRPLVLWAGVERSETLQQLAEQIDRTTAPLGFPPERRPYAPHVTLTRCRVGRRETPLPTPDTGERAFPVFGVDHFALMQTSSPEARPKGTRRRYNIVHTFPLGDTHLSAAR